MALALATLSAGRFSIRLVLLGLDRFTAFAKRKAEQEQARERLAILRNDESISARGKSNPIILISAREQRVTHGPTKHTDEDDEEETPRDIDVEVQSFIVRHSLDITIGEVFHLSPELEDDSNIRQHNHVAIRTARDKHPLVLCMTSLNWDELPVEGGHVIWALAAEGSLLEQSSENLSVWCEIQGFDPDRRSVERKFRQTIAATNALRRLLGEAAYVELLTLYGELAPTNDDFDDDDDLDDEDEG